MMQAERKFNDEVAATRHFRKMWIKIGARHKAQGLK
jgi:hypothetical protein